MSAGSVNATALGRTDRHNSSRKVVKVIPEPSVSGYAVIHQLDLVLVNGKRKATTHYYPNPYSPNGRRYVLSYFFLSEKEIPATERNFLTCRRTNSRGRRAQQLRSLDRFRQTGIREPGPANAW